MVKTLIPYSRVLLKHLANSISNKCTFISERLTLIKITSTQITEMLN